MNYFFTFFLQALLPFSLLLGVYHSKQSSVSAKKIIWLSLFGFIAGIVLRLSLPSGQITNLIVNAVILVLLIIFALCLIFGKGRLPAFSLWEASGQKIPTLPRLFLQMSSTRTQSCT